MAETKDIAPGTYTLELGKTFTEQRRTDGPSYHTLRYDFKPMSVASSDSDTYIALGANGDVHVAVPTDGENMTVFKGSKKEAKAKECLLFVDKKTGKLRLEKISSNINVKKTRLVTLLKIFSTLSFFSFSLSFLVNGMWMFCRDLDPSVESVLRSEMARLRTARIDRPPPPEPSSSSFPGADSSSSSDSSSDDSDSDSGSGSDDEDKQKTRRDSNSSMADSDVESMVTFLLLFFCTTLNFQFSGHLLETMKASGPTTFNESIDMPALDAISQPPPPQPLQQNSYQSRPSTKTDHRDLGLNLSESSDEDE
ncbi:hypothetical protein Aduo_001584 [Ancylostoma duodenale]